MHIPDPAQPGTLERRVLERSTEDGQVDWINRQIEQLLRQRAGIEANRVARDEEDDERREARYARNDVREAKAEVRYALTGRRRARDANNYPVFVLWNYIYERWRKAGSPDWGVEIPFNQIRQHLSKHCVKRSRTDVKGFSERRVQGLIEECDLRRALDVRKHGQRPRTYLPKMDGVIAGSDLFSLRLLREARS